MAPTSVVDRSELPGTLTDPMEARIVEAMLDCIGRWGVGKTTADDIARTAGISRATLYRVFPGGKDVAFEALIGHETARFFAAIDDPLTKATSLEDVIAIGLVEAARFLRDHAPLQYLLAHEPERVVPSVAFGGLDRAFAIATGFSTPHLRRFMADDRSAAAGAEWLVRQFFSYALIPSAALTLTDEAEVRAFARTYLLPALTPAQA